jgi:hypothetical protein
MRVKGLMIPSWSAAVATMILKVEPGGYWPWIARAVSGRRGCRA